MPRPLPTLALTACAAALIGCPAVAADAAAHPRPDHHAMTHSHGKPTPHKPRSHKPVDHLAGPRKGAGQALAARLKEMKALAAKAASQGLADGDALATALAADTAALKADVDGVASATTVNQLRLIVSAGGTTVAVGKLQYRGVVSADDAVTRAAKATATIADLEAKLQLLAAEGTDIAAGEAAIADAQAALAKVAPAAAQVVTAVTGIDPNASRTDLRHVTADVDQALEVASSAVDDANRYLESVQTD